MCCFCIWFCLFSYFLPLICHSLSCCPAQLKLLRCVLSMECLCMCSIRWEGQIQAPVAQERRVLWMKAPSLYFQTIVKSWGDNPSYGPLKSTIFHGFGSHGWIRASISPEPFKVWTWQLHNWIQQRLRFKRMCRNIVTTLLDLELWTPEFSYVSWIWFRWVDSWCHISPTWQPMDTVLAPLDTAAKIEV